MSVSLSITKTQNPSVEGERIRSVTQYTPSEVEKIVKDEVTLSLEELLSHWRQKDAASRPGV